MVFHGIAQVLMKQRGGFFDIACLDLRHNRAVVPVGHLTEKKLFKRVSKLTAKRGPKEKME